MTLFMIFFMTGMFFLNIYFAQANIKGAFKYKGKPLTWVYGIGALASLYGVVIAVETISKLAVKLVS